MIKQTEWPRGRHPAIRHVRRYPMLPLDLTEIAAHSRLPLEVDDPVGGLATGDRKKPPPMPLGDAHVGAEHLLRLRLLNRIPVPVIDSHPRNLPARARE